MQQSIRVDQPFPIIRATVPLDGTIPWTADRCPFVLKTAAGVELVTQWEQVAGEPEDWRRVRVAEVLAIAPPNVTGPATYKLELANKPRRDTGAKPGAWARRLAADGGLGLYVDGVAPPFQQLARYRSGPCAVTIALSAPHAFAWLTVYEDLDVAWLDLVVHNAEPGRPDWAFHELGLVGAVPPLAFEPAWHEPGLAPLPGGWLALVRARADGKMHGLEQRGWRVFQGALHDNAPANLALAQALVAGGGWGVSDAWDKVDAYQPHAMRLPKLGYRAPEMRTTLRNGWNAIAAALQSGAPFGMGSTQGGRLDWRHPWGPYYGGVTGGSYRHQWCGVEIAASGEFAGIRELRARLRMIADRSSIAIVRADGRAAQLEDWILSTGQAKGGWRMSASDATFHVDGAFGWSTAQSTIPPAAIAPEFQQLLQFAPIDFQHADRAQKPAEALVYLANDPIARWWVGMSAELWKMARFTDNRLAGDLAHTQQSPAHGGTVGRADGHGWSNAAAAFAFGRAAHRTRWLTWFETFAKTLVDGQMPNGLFRADWGNKAAKTAPFGNGNLAAWGITKGTEEALVAAALFAVARSVPLAAGLDARAIESVDRWTVDGLWKFLAGAGSAPGTFSDYVGVLPITWTTNQAGYPVAHPGEPLLADATNVVRLAVDRTEIASPLGCAMLMRKLHGVAPAPEQLLALKEYTLGAIDALAWMRSQSLYKLELDDCAPAHAALDF